MQVTNQLNPQTIDQNPFKQQVNQPSGNPFGDSFTPLNDNELFGIEFDRIRHQNEKLAAAQSLIHPSKRLFLTRLQ